MKQLSHLERRLQDLERQFQNQTRMGEIVDVKHEGSRWFVKMNDGENKQPSGSGEGDGKTLRSDWLPWRSFSHGTIKSSVPPKKGQKVMMSSPGGMPEMATVIPYHYGPDTPSPHDKQDETVHLYEDEDEEQQQGQQSGSTGSSGGIGGGSSSSQQNGQSQDKWNKWEHETKNKHHLIISKKEQSQDQDGQSGVGNSEAGASSSESSSGQTQRKQKTRKIPEIDEDGKDDTLQVKSFYDDQSSQQQSGGTGGSGSGGSSDSSQNKNLTHLMTVGKKKAKIKATKDLINVWMGDKKAQVNMTEDKVEMLHSENKSKVVLTKDDITISFGGDSAATKWVMSDKKIQIDIDSVRWTLDTNGWKQEQGRIKHDDKNIGKTHVHTNVQPGGGLSGIPKISDDA
jgi:hypothetical protein